MSVLADQTSLPVQRVGLAKFFKVLADPTRLALLEVPPLARTPG